MSEVSGIAVFRQPYSDEVTLVVQKEGTPAELFSCAELNGRSGFVIAPFEVKPEQPILLIHPDKMEQMSLAALAALPLEIPVTNGIGMTGAAFGLLPSGLRALSPSVYRFGMDREEWLLADGYPRDSAQR